MAFQERYIGTTLSQQPLRIRQQNSLTLSNYMYGRTVREQFAIGEWTRERNQSRRKEISKWRKNGEMVETLVDSRGTLPHSEF